MKILIVDDEPVTQKLLGAMLKEYGHADLAGTGDEALNKFKAASAANVPYDLIFLDIVMPESSGQHVLMRIRQMEEAAEIPNNKRVKIVMLSGLNDASNVVGAFQNGCEAYVTKPVVKKKLVLELLKIGIEAKNIKSESALAK